MGVNTTRCKVLAFVVSAALAGIAGGLSGQLFANPLNPQNLNFVKSIEVVVMIVLGGIGSITGAVFGATTLTVLPEALRTFDRQFPGLRMVVYALLLILLMIFRPQGVFGRREFGWNWLRLPSRTKIPVALADATDAREHTDRRPVDRRSTLGEGDRDD
jgi:branched-chain amino acid transport system permease protein